MHAPWPKAGPCPRKWEEFVTSLGGSLSDPMPKPESPPEMSELGPLEALFVLLVLYVLGPTEIVGIKSMNDTSL